jgi:acetyltransferase-like isoleucine patch superfamily enzyme
MPECGCDNPDQVRAQFAAFRRGDTGQRSFSCPTRPPYHLQGLCYCDAPLPKALWFYLKAAITGWLLRLPFQRPKIWALRKWGTKIGCNVNISVDVWIDPLFPDLLEIEDNVTIGTGARIALHYITSSEFRAGRVIIRKGAVIGGFSLISCGIEIGEGATVAGGAVVGRDVPPHATAIGNPARIVHRREGV